MIAGRATRRLIGYGGMLMESFVGVMAMIAAASLDPGVYFAMNAPLARWRLAEPAAARDPATGASSVTPDSMQALAARWARRRCWRAPAARPSLAVGMAQIFSASTSALGGAGLTALWYHFAIMFEALFILTTLDAGTRVGRFMLQELVGHVWKPLGQTSWYPSVLLVERAGRRGLGLLPVPGRAGSAGRHQLALAAVRDRNQLLAAVALCVGDDGHHQDGASALRVGDARARSPGSSTSRSRRAGRRSSRPIRGSASSRTPRRSPGDALPNAGRLIFNDRLDAAVALLFMASSSLLMLASIREWWLILSRRKPPVSLRRPFVERRMRETEGAPAPPAAPGGGAGLRGLSRALPAGRASGSSDRARIRAGILRQ